MDADTGCEEQLMAKTLFGGTAQQVFMGLVAALMFILAIEASQFGFSGGGLHGFFGWDGKGSFGWHSASITDDDGVIRIQVREDGCRIRLEQEGAVVFTADERDFASLSPDAGFELEVRGCGDKFELKASPGATVGLPPVIAAKLGGKDAAWDEVTRERFHKALQLVFETTGFDAEGRVERLYQSGGAAGVLAVAGKMQSDWGQRIYLHHLLGKESLTPAETAEVWKLAGRSLGSDYELAQMIIEAPPRHSADPAVKAAKIDALRSIASDYELRRSFDHLLEQGVDGKDLDDMLSVAASKLSSDYEQAEFLQAVANNLPAGSPLPASLDAALGTLSSDYELRRALDPFLERPGLSRADLERLLQVANRGISSDYEMAELLVHVAEHQKGPEPWPPAVKLAIDGMASDYEQERAREAFE
jgi:hypothetical protein